MHYIFSHVAEVKKTYYMDSLSLLEGRSYSIEYNEDVMTLYESYTDITRGHPLTFEFVGEQAVDLGGVMREVFAGFYDEMYK